jgi:hypothetical protein
VKVFRDGACNNRVRWVERRRLTRLPLTGLARKILRAAEII